jgi:hypothetical protein
LDGSAKVEALSPQIRAAIHHLLQNARNLTALLDLAEVYVNEANEI